MAKSVSQAFLVWLEIGVCAALNAVADGICLRWVAGLRK